MDEKREESVGPGDLSDHVLERHSMYTCTRVWLVTRVLLTRPVMGVNHSQFVKSIRESAERRSVLEV